ncbi:MAG: biotin carboxylase N-terminal domain-containing protein [Wenzhouxiangellaceae bacterium]|nr:biotin carboxylase N-terminal domain-containing protein [Wenzhouxiangellaceae bacterium]
MFETVLVANRGEIAVRIMRSARALGYRSVAVFSPADAGALHVAMADRAVALDGNEAAASYLDIDQLIAAAACAGADAVHPGYGFLAENADFAQACIDAGLAWIGPPPEAIAAMGNKRRAKALMIEAGVPTIPGSGAGSGGGEHDADELARIAVAIGLPVMVKAAAGGGGKGMRKVFDEAELPAAIRSAASEAQSSFGNAELLVEKALTAARHVEVQVFADGHGNVIHLGERDCSMQRRHQKIIEECPSPAVDEALRRRMGQAAVDAVRAIGYVGAGTVEFMLDADGNFYFLEMNTRLQVEHPVTEAVTGFDLVAWQLQVAAGQPLPVGQDAVSWSGHAIEARLYAEAPGRGFVPQSGRLLGWRMPAGDGVRIDAGVREGQQVSPHYDPLMAKIIAHGPDRESARRRLLRALEDTVALGVSTNRAYLVRALAQPAFVEGRVDTGFVEQHDQALSVPAARGFRLAVAAALLAGASPGEDPGADSWRRAGLTRTLQMTLDDGGQETRIACRVTAIAGGWQVEIGSQTIRIELHGADQQPDQQPGQCPVRQLAYRVDGLLRRMSLVRDGQTLWLADESGDLEVCDKELADSAGKATLGHGRISAPMDGSVIEVTISVGETVARGQALVVMEAMKMETTLSSDIDGVVKELTVSGGDQLKKGQMVAVIEASTDLEASLDDAS